MTNNTNNSSLPNSPSDTQPIHSLEECEPDERFPQFTDDFEYVFINTYEGVIAISTSICKKIIQSDYSESRAGVCGYCGNNTHIYRFEETGQNRFSGLFIHLCDDCEPSVKSDLQALISDHTVDILASNI